MKLFLIIAILVATTLAEAPAASGSDPKSSGASPSSRSFSGRLLVLPARQQVHSSRAPQPPAEYSPTATETPEDEPTEPSASQPEDAPQGDSERLVDGGVYYILQTDGKLQMVRYTTAPLNQKQPFQQQKNPTNKFGDASNFDSQRVQPDKFQQQKQAQLSQVQAHQAQFQYKPTQYNQQPAQYDQQPAQYDQQPAQFNQQQTQFSQQSSQFSQQSQSAQYNQQPAQYNSEPTPFHYIQVQKSVEVPVAQPAQSNQQPAQSNQQPAKYNQQPAQYNPEPTPFHYIQVQRSVEVPVAQPALEQSNGGFVANVQYRDVEPISAPIYAYNPTPLVRILKK